MPNSIGSQLIQVFPALPPAYRCLEHTAAELREQLLSSEAKRASVEAAAGQNLEQQRQHEALLHQQHELQMRECLVQQVRWP